MLAKNAISQLKKTQKTQHQIIEFGWMQYIKKLVWEMGVMSHLHVHHDTKIYSHPMDLFFAAPKVY